MGYLAAHPDRPITNEILKSLPKISLHDHLDGGVRPETIVELAAEAGVPLPFTDGERLANWIAEQSNAGTLSAYLKPFSFTGAVTQTQRNLVRVAREFVQDLADDGVIYGEIRWAPENHLRQGLTLDQAVEAVQEGIEAGVADVTATGKNIQVGQILAAMRHDSLALSIAELAVRHRNQGVVGFDIAGPEAGFPASQHAAAFDHLASNFLPATVHAGEGDGLESIRSALVHGRALRLGHGVRLAEDLTQYQDSTGTHTALGDMARWVRDRRIALEISPSSNLQTGAIAQWGTTMTDHPFDLLYKAGLRVTVNADNRLMSNTNLTKELGLLINAFNYTLTDLKTFQLDAAESAFLPSHDRSELKAAIQAGFSDALN